LIRNRLLLLNPPDGMDTHTSRRVHPAPRLLQWMLRDRAVSMSDGAVILDTVRPPFVPTSTGKRLAQLDSALQTPITVAIVGGTTGMREGVAMAVARQAKRPLVRVDVERCKAYLREPYDLVRDLMLDGAIPYLVNVPDTSEEPTLRMQMMALGTALSELPYTVTVGGNDRRAVSAMLGSDRPNVTVPVGRSSNAERIEAWAEAMGRRGWDRAKAQELAERGYTYNRILGHYYQGASLARLKAGGPS
jgi:hypothetical protein